MRNSRMCAPESVFSTRSVVGLHPRGLVRWRKPQACARSWRAAAKMRRSRSDDPWRYAGLHPVPPRAWKIQREKMQKARAACLARPRVRRSGSGRARSARPTQRSGSRGSRPSRGSRVEGSGQVKSLWWRRYRADQHRADRRQHKHVSFPKNGGCAVRQLEAPIDRHWLYLMLCGAPRERQHFVR